MTVPMHLDSARPSFLSLLPEPARAFDFTTQPHAHPIKLMRKDPSASDATMGGQQHLAETQRAFAEVLSIADRRPDQVDRAEQAREAAERLVSATLVEPTLKQLRESNTTPPPFGPGPAEKKFRALGDAFAAREIVRSQRFELVDRLARDMRSRSGAIEVFPKADPS